MFSYHNEIFNDCIIPYSRNGAVRFESVMRLRNKLDELGKMEGVSTAEKGWLIASESMSSSVTPLSTDQIQRSF